MNGRRDRLRRTFEEATLQDEWKDEFIALLNAGTADMDKNCWWHGVPVKQPLNCRLQRRAYARLGRLEVLRTLIHTSSPPKAGT